MLAELRNESVVVDGAVKSLPFVPDRSTASSLRHYRTTFCNRLSIDNETMLPGL